MTRSMYMVGKFDGDVSGFDYATLMRELSRLGLRNQEIAMSVQTIDATTEDGLALGLASCRREKVYDTGGADIATGKRETMTQQYLNAKCALSHVQHYDEEHLDNSKRDLNHPRSVISRQQAQHVVRTG
jgi:hypothetical protein